MSYAQTSKTQSAQEPPQARLERSNTQFVDSRPSTIAHLQLQRVMHNSAQTLAQSATQRVMNQSHVSQQKTIQLSGGGGQQDVLLRVDNVKAKGTPTIAPSDGSKELVLISDAIATMKLLINTLATPAPQSTAYVAFQPRMNELAQLLKTLETALQQGDENLTGNFIDAEAIFYENQIIPIQTQLMNNPPPAQDALYKPLRNNVDKLHVTAQLINNLREIRYGSGKSTTVAVEIGGYLATAQTGKNANLPKVPTGASDIYLWNIVQFTPGSASLTQAMEQAAAALKIANATFYFHAQPWVAPVYQSKIGATVV